MKTSSTSPDDRAVRHLRVAVVGADEVTRRRVAAQLDVDRIAVAAAVAGVEELAEVDHTDLEAFVVFCGSRDHEASRALVRSLGKIAADLPLVAVVGGSGYRSIRAVLDAGADAVVLEDRLDQTLALAIRSAHAGQISVPQELRPAIARPTLSPREKQILGMVVMGFMNVEIAQKLCIAETTVKSHLSSAFAKLRVRSRAEATALILDTESGFGTGILAISGETDANG